MDSSSDSKPLLRVKDFGSLTNFEAAPNQQSYANNNSSPNSQNLSTNSQNPKIMCTSYSYVANTNFPNSQNVSTNSQNPKIKPNAYSQHSYVANIDSPNSQNIPTNSQNLKNLQNGLDNSAQHNFRAIELGYASNRSPSAVSQPFRYSSAINSSSVSSCVFPLATINDHIYFKPHNTPLNKPSTTAPTRENNLQSSINQNFQATYKSTYADKIKTLMDNAQYDGLPIIKSVTSYSPLYEKPSNKTTSTASRQTYDQWEQAMRNNLVTTNPKDSYKVRRKKKRKKEKRLCAIFNSMRRKNHCKVSIARIDESKLVNGTLLDVNTPFLKIIKKAGNDLKNPNNAEKNNGQGTSNIPDTKVIEIQPKQSECIPDTRVIEIQPKQSESIPVLTPNADENELKVAVVKLEEKSDDDIECIFTKNSNKSTDIVLPLPTTMNNSSPKYNEPINSLQKKSPVENSNSLGDVSKSYVSTVRTILHPIDLPKSSSSNISLPLSTPQVVTSPSNTSQTLVLKPINLPNMPYTSNFSDNIQMKAPINNTSLTSTLQTQVSKQIYNSPSTIINSGSILKLKPVTPSTSLSKYVPYHTTEVNKDPAMSSSNNTTKNVAHKSSDSSTTPPLRHVLKPKIPPINLSALSSKKSLSFSSTTTKIMATNNSSTTSHNSSKVRLFKKLISGDDTGIKTLDSSSMASYQLNYVCPKSSLLKPQMKTSDPDNSVASIDKKETPVTQSQKIVSDNLNNTSSPVITSLKTQVKPVTSTQPIKKPYILQAPDDDDDIFNLALNAYSKEFHKSPPENQQTSFQNYSDSPFKIIDVRHVDPDSPDRQNANDFSEISEKNLNINNNKSDKIESLKRPQSLLPLEENKIVNNSSQFSCTKNIFLDNTKNQQRKSNKFEILSDTFHIQSSLLCTKCGKVVPTSFFWIHVLSQELLCKNCVIERERPEIKSSSVKDLMNNIYKACADFNSSDSESEDFMLQVCNMLKTANKLSSYSKKPKSKKRKITEVSSDTE